MRASRLIAVVACLAVAGSGATHVTAAPAKPAPITVVINGLDCSTALGPGTFEARSWSWGATAETTTGGSGGAGSGKAQLASLALTRVSDACSPELLSSLVTGDHFAKLTLSQYDTAGVLKATVILENLILTEWRIGGTDTSEPAEELAVSFAKFTLTDTGGGSKVCWDVPASKGC